MEKKNEIFLISDLTNNLKKEEKEVTFDNSIEFLWGEEE